MPLHINYPFHGILRHNVRIHFCTICSKFPEKSAKCTNIICSLYYVLTDEWYIIQGFILDFKWRIFQQKNGMPVEEDKNQGYMSNVDHKMTHFIPRFFFFPFLSLSGFAAATFWVRISRIKS